MISTIIFKSNGNGNVNGNGNSNGNGNGNDYLYLAFLAQNGEGTVTERSRNDQKKIGHDERTARNGTVTVQERKN